MKDLNKLAEEFYMDFHLSENGPMEGDLVIPESDAWRLMVAFHKHALKAHLDGVKIHTMIPDHEEYGNGYHDGANTVINELKKSVE